MDARLTVTLPQLMHLAGAAQQLSNPPAQLPPGAMAGERTSRQQGRGLNFDSLRSYQPGDDVRLIDWQATARLRAPWVRLYNEERERPVILLVDQRLDMYFSTRGQTKSAAAAEIAALLAWRCWHDNDRLGSAVFSDDEIAFQRCRSPKRSLHPLFADLLRLNQSLASRYPREPAQPLSFTHLLQQMSRQIPAGSWVAIISDFHDMDAECEALLARLHRRCEISAFVVLDDVHLRLPASGELAASYQQQRVALSLSPQLQRQIADVTSGRLARQEKRLLSLGIEVRQINVGEPILHQLQTGGARAGKRL